MTRKKIAKKVTKKVKSTADADRALRQHLIDLLESAVAEHPQLRRTQQQPRQQHASFLAGREMARREMLSALQAEPTQHQTLRRPREVPRSRTVRP